MRGVNFGKYKTAAAATTSSFYGSVKNFLLQYVADYAAGIKCQSVLRLTQPGCIMTLINFGKQPPNGKPRIGPGNNDATLRTVFIGRTQLRVGPDQAKLLHSPRDGT